MINSPLLLHSLPFLRQTLLIAAITLAGSAGAATLTVTNLDDLGPGSLRESVNAAAAGDTIDFASNLSGAIVLSTGEISIAKDLTIQGPGADSLAISGVAGSRVFQVTSGAAVTFSGLEVSGGAPRHHNGGGLSCENATVRIDACVFRNNSAFSGGAIVVVAEFGASNLTIINSTIHNNTAESGGGGVCNLAFLQGESTVTIVNSTFSENAATNDFQFSSYPNGGAILNQSNSGTGTVRIAHSTFARNYAYKKNWSGYAGDTIGNRVHVPGGKAILEVGHSIFSSHPTHVYRRHRVFGVSGSTVTSLGYNICSDGADGMLDGPGDLPNTDALLEPLTDNGGPTPTHALMLGSPAIDGGDPALASHAYGVALTNDQRGSGYARAVQGIAGAPAPVVDIGAVEFFPRVTAEVPTGGFTFRIDDPAIDLAATVKPQPPGGGFSGPGVVNGVFTPAAAGPGTHTITYGIANGSHVSGVLFEIRVYRPPVPAGVYTGLVQPPPGSVIAHERTGLLRIATNRVSRTFTGTLWLGGVRHMLNGSFDAEGESRLPLAGSGDAELLLTLRLLSGMELESVALVGEITSAGETFAVISADRVLYTAQKDPPAPLKNLPERIPGRYTVMFPPKASAPASTPRGYGVGTLTVSADGNARLLVSLPDGSRSSYGNFLVKTNTWPIYLRLASGGGSLSGVATFRDIGGASDLDAVDLDWFKPARSTAARFLQGWPQGINIDLLGSKFHAPLAGSRQSVIPWSISGRRGGNVQIKLTGGKLGDPGLTKNLAVSHRNEVRVIAPGPEDLSINLGHALISHGRFHGSFQPPGLAPRAEFRAVIFQKTGFVAGYYFSENDAGALRIKRRP